MVTEVGSNNFRKSDWETKFLRNHSLTEWYPDFRQAHGSPRMENDFPSSFQVLLILLLAKDWRVVSKNFLMVKNFLSFLIF